MTEWWPQSGSVWLPVVLALGAACFYGLSAITSRRGTANLSPQIAVIVSLGATVGSFLITSPWWARTEDWFNPGIWVFMLLGLVHPVLSMYFWLEAIQRAGATVASTFSATSPLFAACTAVLFLGESLNGLIALGTLACVGGIIILSWAPMGMSSAIKAALLFATGAALLRGVNHTVARYGLEALSNPMMAAFVATCVAFVSSIILYCIRNGQMPRIALTRDMPFMAMTGILSCAGVTAGYAALNVGTVVVVSPLISTYPVFSLVFALMLGTERLSLRVLLGVGTVVGGVVVISLARAM